MRRPLTHNLFFIGLIVALCSLLSIQASLGKSKHISKKSSFSKKRRHSRHRITKTKGHYLPVDPESFETEDNTVMDPDTLGHIYYSKVFNIPVDTGTNINMLHKIENWIGAPYKLGGASHWGIDCSQFARKVYSSVSNSFIGQTCRDIIGRVQRLSQVQLKPGDFVFFKIHGPSASHMGVYLGNNKFVHSSTSKGVMISDLTEPFYQKHFLAGGRANNPNSTSLATGTLSN